MDKIRKELESEVNMCNTIIVPGANKAVSTQNHCMIVLFSLINMKKLMYNTLTSNKCIFDCGMTHAYPPLKTFKQRSVVVFNHFSDLFSFEF